MTAAGRTAHGDGTWRVVVNAVLEIRDGHLKRKRLVDHGEERVRLILEVTQLAQGLSRPYQLTETFGRSNEHYALTARSIRAYPAALGLD